MRVFDASSMIYAWDNYPIGQFPGMWEWMGSQIEAKQVVMHSKKCSTKRRIAGCG